MGAEDNTLDAVEPRGSAPLPRLTTSAARRIAARQRAAVFVHHLGFWLFAILLLPLAAIVLAKFRLVALPWLFGWLLAIEWWILALASLAFALALAAIPAALAAARGVWSPARAAREADRALSTKDTLTAAIELSATHRADERDFVAATVRRAESLAAGVDATRIIQPRFGWAWTAAPITLIALVLAHQFIPQRPDAARLEAQRVAVAKEDARRELASLTQPAPSSQPSAAAAPAPTTEEQAASAAIREIESELANGTIAAHDARTKAAETLTQKSAELENKARTAQRDVDDARRALARATRLSRENRSNPSEPRSVRESLSRPDLEAAARALDELAQSLDNATPDQREAAAQELDSLANNLSENLNQQPEPTAADRRLLEAARAAARDLREPAKPQPPTSPDRPGATPPESTSPERERVGQTPSPNPERPRDNPPSPAQPPAPSDSQPPQPPASQPTAPQSQPPNPANPAQPQQPPSPNQQPNQPQPQPQDQRPNQSPPAPPSNPQPNQPINPPTQPQGPQQGTPQSQPQNAPQPGQQGQSPSPQPNQQPNQPQNQPQPSGQPSSQPSSQPNQQPNPQPSSQPSPSQNPQPSPQPSPQPGNPQPRDGAPQQAPQPAPQPSTQPAPQQTPTPQSTPQPAPPNNPQPNSSSSNPQPNPQSQPGQPSPQAAPGTPRSQPQSQPQPGDTRQPAPAERPSFAPGADSSRPDQPSSGPRRLSEALRDLDQQSKNAARQLESAKGMRDRAEELLRNASPEERAKLEELAKKLAQNQDRSRAPEPWRGPTQSFDARPRDRASDPAAAPPTQRTIAEWLSAPKPGGTSTSGPITEPVRRAQESANDAIERQEIPPQYADLVKRVFRRYTDSAAKPETPPANIPNPEPRR